MNHKNLSFVDLLEIALLASCVALATTVARGEPILGGESLTTPSDSVEKQEVTDALSLFKEGDYDGSLSKWKQAVTKNADLPPAQVIMAGLFFRANLPEEAQHALEQAIADAPDDPEAYVMLANVALAKRDVEKVESWLQKAENLMPEFQKSEKRKTPLQAQIFRTAAGVSEVRGDWPAAQKVYEEWSQQEPANIAPMQRIAYCLFRQNDEEGALAKLREIAERNPQALAPEAVLAQFYQQSDDAQNAEKWMDAAVAAAPKNLATRLAAGYSALDRGDFDGVRKNALAAALIDSNSFDAKMLRGLAAVCQKDFVAAELFFDSALRQSPDNFVASNNLALSLIEQGEEVKDRRALELAEGNVKRYPSSASAASTYGWVLYKLKRLDEAEKALRAAAAAGPVSVDTAYYMARVLVDLDRKNEAREFLEPAIQRKGISMFREEAEELLKELTP